MAAVSVSQLWKSFGAVPVLKGVSLDAADGEFLTLLGPSGCGKSTLLRIIAGLELQDRGTVEIDGRAVDGDRPKDRDVAMVFQSYALYPHMTVAENLALPLRMRRLSAVQRLPIVGRFLPGSRSVEADIDQAVARTAVALEIEPLLKRKPGQLSGGQRQRVALGRAVVREPRVFLMDEPLSNLDAKLRVQMRAELKELHRRLGVTFIYVTHDQAEAMTLSDRVAVMLDGELMQVARPDRIYADPDHLRVAAFLGSPQVNLIPAVGSDDGAFAAASASFMLDRRAQPKQAATLGIRPEAFSIADRVRPGAIEGRVRLVEHMGPDLFVHVEYGGRSPLVVRCDPKRRDDLDTDTAVAVVADPGQVMLFDETGVRLRSEPARSNAPPLRSLAS